MESLDRPLRVTSAAAAFGVRLHRFDAAVERALREWERDEELAAVTLVTASIDIDAPPGECLGRGDGPAPLRRVGDDPRRINARDAGPAALRAARSSRRCALRGAPFKVHWTLTGPTAPRHAHLGGPGPRTPAPARACAKPDGNGQTGLSTRSVKAAGGVRWAPPQAPRPHRRPSRARGRRASLQRLKALIEDERSAARPCSTSERRRRRDRRLPRTPLNLRGTAADRRRRGRRSSARSRPSQAPRPDSARRRATCFSPGVDVHVFEDASTRIRPPALSPQRSR